MSPFSVTWYLLATVVFFLDFLDLLLRLHLRRENTLQGAAGQMPATSVPLEVGEFTPYEARLHLKPFAIVASIHNLDRESLDWFLDVMSRYRQHLWVIDDASTDDTWERLRDSGVRCVRSPRNGQKPAGIKSLLDLLPQSIESIVVVDPDARFMTTAEELHRVLFEFQRSGMGAVCPRITIRPDGVLTRFQQLEYSVSFTLGRKSLGSSSITSGIAVYRRDALERVLAGHSLSVYAEDLENTFRLLVFGEGVYYDGRLVVETEGMRTVRRFISQRVGWSFGLIRVYLRHWRDLLHGTRRGFTFTYQYVVYMGVLGLVAHPLKVLALFLLPLSALNGLDNLWGLNLIVDSSATNPRYFLAMYVQYTVLVAFVVPLAVPYGSRRRVAPVVPFYVFYAMAQIVPVTFGYLNWFSLRLWGRPIYRDHYRPVAP